MTNSSLDLAFESLTRSALDFLNQAARDLKKAPKYAVINMATAIELFLKARLVREHWSLLVARPESATRATFESGSFQSVGLNDSIERLRNIAGLNLSKNEEAAFRELRDHRNKLVHFFHEDYLTNPSKAVLSNITAEQCRAWFLLRRLLENHWSPAFEPYATEFRKINKLIEKNREFLDGKFRALRPEINAAIKAGSTYETCGSCGHLSTEITEWFKPIVESRCAVCERYTKYVDQPCPDCGTPIRIEDVGEGTCSSCGYKTTLPWLVEQLGPYEDPKEDPETAYCSFCENPEARSVIPIGDALVCLACWEEHSRIGQCGWCGESVAGDLDDSYVTGCMMCDGKMGWDDS